MCATGRGTLGIWPSNRTLARMNTIQTNALASFVKKGMGCPLFPESRMTECSPLISVYGGSDLSKGTPTEYCAYECKYELPECDAFRIKESSTSFKCYFYKNACVEFATERRGDMYPSGLEDRGLYASYSYYELKANER